MSANRTILIVDDEINIRENIAEYLHEFNFKTILAENGVDGLQKAIENKPDLILCDVDMPKINGHELYSQIQKLPDLSLIPFIFLTAKSSQKDFREGMLLGADDYIAKPFVLKDILMSVNRRLEKASRIKENSNLMLKTLAENELVGVFYYQSDGFTYTNKKIRKMLDYSHADLKEKKIREIITGGEKDAIVEKIEACLDGVFESILIESYLRTGLGKPIHVYLSLHHLNIDMRKTIVGIVLENEKENFSSNGTSAYSSVIEQLKNMHEYSLVDKLEKIFKESNYFNINNQRERKIKKVKFTQREKEVLSLICDGFTNVEIGEKLCLSNRTIENHRAKILNKTNSKNTAQLVAFGVKYLNL